MQIYNFMMITPILLLLFLCILFLAFNNLHYLCIKHQEMPIIGTPTEFFIEITTVVKGCVSECST